MLLTPTSTRFTSMVYSSKDVVADSKSAALVGVVVRLKIVITLHFIHRLRILLRITNIHCAAAARVYSSAAAIGATLTIIARKPTVAASIISTKSATIATTSNIVICITTAATIVADVSTL